MLPVPVHEHRPRGGVAWERVPAAEHGGEHGVGLPLRERLGGGRVLLPTDVEEDRSGGGGIRRLHRRRCWPCRPRRLRLRAVGVLCDEVGEEEGRGIWNSGFR